MIKQLAHLCIFAEDLEKTSWFYEDVLGLDKTFEFVKNGEVIGFYIGLGKRTFLEVFQSSAGVKSPGNIDHLSLEVEDMDALLEKLRSHELKVSDKLLGADHSWQAWTSDPDGVKIELHEYTEASLQLRGGRCRLES